VSRFETRAGSVVLTERSRALPVVGVGVSLRKGTLHDPEDKAGITVLTARALRMGPKGLSSRALEDRLDGIGGQLGISASQSYVHVGGVVVAKNVEPFVKLIADVLLRPGLRPADVRQVKHEMLTDLEALTDDDRTLCFRHFRRLAFGDHRHGRPRGGSRASVAKLGLADVSAQHRRMLDANDMVLGVWGDFEPTALRTLLDRRFGRVPTRAGAALALPEPLLARGRRVLIVDKPERTQCQIAIGTFGTSAHDRDHVALVVANTAFGGLFSSRLNDEVRVRRGLSYGASSSFTLSRGRDLWAMHTAPAAKDALRCIELQLSLYERWVERGLSATELAAAKRYLHKSHAFEIDTSAKRLDQRLDIELLDFPKNHHSGFLKKLATVTRQEVADALQRRLSTRDLVLTVVGVASELAPKLERLPGVSSVEVVPFDRV
jgi:zinc protease